MKDDITIAAYDCAELSSADVVITIAKGGTMKPPANYRPREGDVVLVRAKVTIDCDPGDPYVHLKVNHTRVGVDLKDLEGIITRTWKPKDRVRNVHDLSDRGVVIAVCDGMAWVKLNSGAFYSYAALDLEDDDPPPPPERAVPRYEATEPAAEEPVF